MYIITEPLFNFKESCFFCKNLLSFFIRDSNKFVKIVRNVFFLRAEGAYGKSRFPFKIGSTIINYCLPDRIIFF
jgi:hypothetical protein